MIPMSESLSDDAERSRLTERLRRALLKQESPRLQMAVLVSLSGGAGFLASVALLRAGLERIPVRYVSAVAIAYGVFLLLLWFWILRRRGQIRGASGGGRSSSGDFDPVGVLDFGGGSSGGSGGSSGFSAGGGRFGGGGASGGWGGSVAKASSSGGGGLDLDLDGDDAIVVIVIAAAALVLLGASVWIVFTAPTLFAELLLDGGLSAGLYRRLGRVPREPWLETALKKTIVPFLVAALTLGAAGLVMERHAPEARSLGGVLAHRGR